MKKTLILLCAVAIVAVSAIIVVKSRASESILNLNIEALADDELLPGEREHCIRTYQEQDHCFYHYKDTYYNIEGSKNIDNR